MVSSCQEIKNVTVGRPGKASTRCCGLPGFGYSRQRVLNEKGVVRREEYGERVQAEGRSLPGLTGAMCAGACQERQEATVVMCGKLGEGREMRFGEKQADSCTVERPADSRAERSLGEV